MSHELDYAISADEVTSDDLYPKGNVQRSHPYLFPTANPQHRYPELYPNSDNHVSRREILRKGPGALLTITALGATAYNAYSLYEEYRDFKKDKQEQNSVPEITTDPIFLPSLPDGYLEGLAILDFASPLQLDISAFEDRPFDVRDIDFFNRFRDVDTNRMILIQNPFLDVRQDEEGNASRWLTLVSYIDTTSQEFLTGGSYRGLYINMKPADEHFADVPFLGKAYSLEECTAEQVAYHPDYEFVRNTDQKVIDGSTIGTISQNPKELDDFLKKIL